MALGSTETADILCESGGTGNGKDSPGDGPYKDDELMDRLDPIELRHNIVG